MNAVQAEDSTAPETYGLVFPLSAPDEKQVPGRSSKETEEALHSKIV